MTSLDNRVAIHALLAGAADPGQVGGLFVLAVPGHARRYFWAELQKHGATLIDAAADIVDGSRLLVRFKNKAVVRVLSTYPDGAWKGIGDVAGVVFYGRDVDEELVDWAQEWLSREPRGWMLVA